MKRLMKTLSLLLCIVMVISSLPISVLAATKKDVKEEKAETVTVSELKDKRDIYSKTYETSKGTNVIVSSAVPLHYEKDGKLVDIDNTLVKSEKDDSKLTNKSNSFNVELPKKMTADSEISLNKEISFKLINEDISSSKGAISKKEETKIDETNSENVARKESNIDSLSSSIEYKNVLDKTDVEYTVSNNQLKENIIINELPLEDYSISYELNIGKLKAELNKDNSITIFNKKDEPEYIIEKPYMFDCGENESEDIKVSLEQQDGTYLLTYAPSFEWLSNENIAYPVTLDPTITLQSRDGNGENIEDSYINSNNRSKNRSFPNADYMSISNKANNICWGLLYFNTLPTLKQTYRIINASLNISTKNDYLDNSPLSIAAHEINDNQSFSNLAAITWNNNVSIKERVVDRVPVPSTQSDISLNLTNTIKKWYSNSNLVRLLVLNVCEETAVNHEIRIASNSADNLNKPYLTLEYVDVNGINKKYKYHEQDIGLAGKAYINDYTGQLTIKRDEIDMRGYSEDIIFYNGNNVNMPDNNLFGDNVSINYFQTLQKDGNEYTITEGDGTIRKLINGENGNDFITVSDPNNNSEIIAVEWQYSVDDKNYSYYFENNIIDSSSGEFVLTKTSMTEKDNNNNEVLTHTTNVNYNSSNNWDYIESISNDLITAYFNYSNHILNSIEYYSESDNESFDKIVNENGEDIYILSLENSYSTNNNTHTVRLGYDGESSDNCMSVRYITGNNTYTVYDEFGVHYVYTFNNNGQVVRVQEYSADNTPGNYLEFDYSDNNTIVSDGTSTTTELFDYNGELLSITDENGNTIFTKYNGDTIDKISKTRNSARNVVDFFGFERSNDNFYKRYSGLTLSTNEKMSGAKSLMMTAPTSGHGDKSYTETISGLTPGASYTVSLMVKTTTDFPCEVKLFNVDHSAEAGHYVKKTTDASNEWQRLYSTINAGSDGKIDVQFVIYDTNTNTSTNIYIDELYYQKSPYLTNPNLLLDSEFSDANCAAWQNKVAEETNENISTNDNYRLKIVGDYDNSKSVYQTVNISATEGTKFVFGGWMKAIDALPNFDRTDRDFSIKIYPVLSNGNDGQAFDASTIYYSTYFNDWQYFESEITLNTDYGPNESYIGLKFEINYNHQMGTAYVDGVSLLKDSLYTVDFDTDLYGNPVGIGTTEVIEDTESVPSPTSSLTKSIYYQDALGIKLEKYEASVDENTIHKAIKDSFYYRNNGTLLSHSKDIFNNITDYRFDYFGNVTSVDDASGRIVEYEYDNFNNRSSVYDSICQKDSNYSGNVQNTPIEVDNFFKKAYRDGEIELPESLEEISLIEDYLEDPSILENESFLSQLENIDIPEITDEGVADCNEMQIYLLAENIIQKYGEDLTQYYTGLEKNDICIKYTYEGRRLVKIETGNALSDESFESYNTYEFEYDEWNNLTDVYVNKDENNPVAYIHYEYDSEKYRQLNSIEYSNNQEINYRYNDNGSIAYEYDTSNSDGDTLSYSYFYYDDGSCYARKNLITGCSESYQDDITTWFDEEGNILLSYGTNNKKEVFKQIYDNFVKTINSDNSFTNEINGDKYNILREYDSFGRISKEKIYSGELVNGEPSYPYISKEYVYYAHGTDFTETPPIAIEGDGDTLKTSTYLRYLNYYIVTDGGNGEPVKTDLKQFKNLYEYNGNVWAENSTTQWSSNAITGVARQYTYNSANMLVKNTPVFWGYSSDYRFDQVGNINEMTISYKPDSIALLEPGTEKTDYTFGFGYDTNSGSMMKNCLTNVSLTKHSSLNNVNDQNANIDLSYDSIGNVNNISLSNSSDNIDILNGISNIDFTWSRGNTLSSSIINNNEEAEYCYNSDNVRIKKSVDNGNVDNTQTDYLWEKGNLVAESIVCSGTEYSEVVSNVTQNHSGNYNIIMLNDQNNNAYGFLLNKTKDSNGNPVNETNVYYYIKDSRNTIRSVVDENGNVIVDYVYDDYGLPKVSYAEGYKYISLLNPLIYRDYIFDKETMLYYIQSRYYSPLFARYINVNGVVDTGSGTIMSTNPYAYCENNPINKDCNNEYKQIIPTQSTDNKKIEITRYGVTIS